MSKDNDGERIAHSSWVSSLPSPPPPLQPETCHPDTQHHTSVGKVVICICDHHVIIKYWALFFAIHFVIIMVMIMITIPERLLSPPPHRHRRRRPQFSKKANSGSVRSLILVIKIIILI